eukprot:snap_masked-scaffold_12-processed-gene-0.17-mRNA-1 protein AED:1.00 eAED:1.00 QI:0/-1/0/0/-1/1/1/0/404
MGSELSKNKRKQNKTKNIKKPSNMTMKTLVQEFSEKDGKLISTVAFKEVEEPTARSLKEDEVLIKILAQPINPTDIALFNPIGGSKVYKQGENSVYQEILPAASAMYKSKVGSSLSIGSEACGKVIATGINAKELEDKIVSLFGFPVAEFGQKKIVHKMACFVHNDGVNVRHAAAALVNPLAVVSFLEQAKADGHSAMVHTAAASNLGKMLVKYCKMENFPLVCVVRKDAQVKELKDLGAEYVVNSTSPGFNKELFESLLKTRATCCFDAVGGGTLGGKILAQMEKALISNMGPAAGKYGSNIKKTLYAYGMLDPNNLEVPKTVGMQYSVEGFGFFQWFGPLSAEEKAKQFKKVADNISTVFKSDFGVELGFSDFVKIDNYKNCVEQKTNSKVLLMPNGPEALN